MFQTLNVETANEAWAIASTWFGPSGVAKRQASRNGETVEVLHAGLAIRSPRQRWIASRIPALNPAFAIIEVIWILGGRSDSAFLNFFNPKLPNFAGRGETYHGAYGRRLRSHFGLDQLNRAYRALLADPSSRQVVLQVWDSAIDFPDESGLPRAEDIPCNISALVKIRDGRLEWTQIMRSNDLFLGLPHNIVQFTSLQEILAGWLDLEVGEYHHYSDSLHLYDNVGNIRARVTPCEVPINSDSLSLGKEESDYCVRRIVGFVESIIQGASSSQILGGLQSLNVHRSFWNLACIVAADATRRLRDDAAVASSLECCNNACLTYMFRRWQERNSTIMAKPRAQC